MNTDIYLPVISFLIFSLRVCCQDETILCFERRRYHLLMALQTIRCVVKENVCGKLAFT